MVVVRRVLGRHHVTAGWTATAASARVVMPAGVARTVSVHYGGHFLLLLLFNVLLHLSRRTKLSDQFGDRAFLCLVFIVCSQTQPLFFVLEGSSSQSLLLMVV